METFTLSAQVTISIYTRVKAETLEDAIKIAEQRSIEASNFRGDNADYCWISDEYDGEVENIHED